MSRTRTLTVGVAAAALILSAVPASAATDTFAAEADAGALTLSLAGNDVLEIASSYASAVPGEALASAVPVAVAGTGIGDRRALSDGPVVSDPADPDDRCLASVPSPLDAILGAGLVCADATADGAQPFAVATSGVGEIGLLSLEGEVLAPLADLLATLPIGALVDAVEEQLLDRISDAFGDVREACLSALDPLNIGGLLAPVLDPLRAATPAQIAALLDTVEGLISGLLPTACDVLGSVADLLLDGDLLGSITSGDLLAELTGADGLVTVSLLETEALAGAEDGEVVALAGPTNGVIEITVDVPLLDDLLGDLLADVLAPVLAQLTTLLAPVADAVSAIPELGPLVAGLLTSGDVSDLLDGPLLSLVVAPGGAAVVGDLATGDLEAEAEAALVELDGALFSLPVLAGLDDALNQVGGLLDGTVLSVLRDSPLGELVSVTLLEESVDDAEVGGLEGLQATSGTASIELLGVVGAVAGAPLLELDVAAATAAVGLGDDVVPSGPEPTPPGTTPVPPATPTGATPTPASLPVTGGSAAVVGLLALAAAAALRRRD